MLPSEGSNVFSRQCLFLLVFTLLLDLLIFYDLMVNSKAAQIGLWKMSCLVALLPQAVLR